MLVSIFRDTSTSACGSRSSPAWSWCLTKRWSLCASPRTPSSRRTKLRDSQGNCKSILTKEDFSGADFGRIALHWFFSDRFRPPAARVSGIVEETPGNLEYEVALFREATNTGGTTSLFSSSDSGANSINEIPVDQAVPIGTKLQLRATINTQSGMKQTK